MNITQINDFQGYVFSLFTNALDYIIFITSSDAHTPKNCQNRKLEILKALGIKTDLQKSFRHSFLAIVDGGEVKVELSSANEKLETTYEFMCHKAEVLSQGFNAKPVTNSPVSVKIDGFEYAVNKRGLNFVIWDKKSSKVLDSVVFDTFAGEQIARNDPNNYEMLYKTYKLLCELSVYSSDFIYRYMERISKNQTNLLNLYEYLNKNGVFFAKTQELLNRGITVLAFKHITAKQITSPTEWERICQTNETPGFMKKDVDKYFEISGMSKIYSRDVFDDILKHPVHTIKVKNYFRHIEQTSKYVNVDSFWQRPTESFPISPYKTIHIFGDSIACTWEMTDKHTLTNQLQELVKEKYRVVNYSVAGTDCYSAGQNMLDVNFEPGDIVVFIWAMNKYTIMENDFKNIGVPVVVLLPYFNVPRKDEVFFDIHHLNPNGYKIMSDTIYKTINMRESTTLQQNKNLLSHIHDNNLLHRHAGDDTSLPFSELSPWLNEISKYHPKIGSIVMNCNPFTLGHRYLIEQSSSKVEKLFIFVVEEDKSIFPFADRIELVRKGTADLPNVTVLPSGKFIISSLTFTDYFEKSWLQDRVIDPSIDVQIFGEYIAPAVGINVRFAGEEPLDNVTKQYNETMARILPKYGVDFEVIQRKEFAGEVISTSRVRRLLEIKDFEGISRLVPAITLNYLMEKYI